MIPRFPDFKKIELDDREAFESYTRQHHPYSTFNFTNVWAWDIRGDRSISELNGNLVVRFTDYATQEPFFSFFGTNACEATARELLAFARESKLLPKLRFVMEEAAHEVGNAGMLVEEDRENSDYIYSIAELAKLAGSKFKERRHLAKRFLQEYPGATFEVRDVGDASVQDQIRTVFRQWEQKKQLDNKIYDPDFEGKALERLLETSAHHKVIASCVFLDDAMLGFSIDELLPDQKAMAHFIKADGTYRGVYEFLNERLAQYLSSRGIVAWNWQQDLNIEGLRATKMSYSPIGLLKKYTVSLA